MRINEGFLRDIIRRNREKANLSGGMDIPFNYFQLMVRDSLAKVFLNLYVVDNYYVHRVEIDGRKYRSVSEDKIVGYD